MAIKSIVRTGKTFLVSAADAQGRGGLWSSIDGRRWSERQLEFGPVGKGQVLDLDVRKETPVAIGYVEKHRADVASFWIAEGKPQRTSLPSVGGESRARALAIGADRIVVVGTARRGTFEPVAWHSRDGRQWGAVHMPMPPHSSGMNVLALDVRHLSSGEFVSVGVIQTGDRVCPLAWRSTDWGQWQLFQVEPCRDGLLAQMASVAPTNEGAVAAGAVNNNAAAWSMAKDGEWQLEWVNTASSEGGGIPEAADRGSLVLATTSLADGRIVAVGWETRENVPRGVMWIRKDDSWSMRRVDPRPASGYTAILASSGGVFVATSPPPGESAEIIRFNL